jgi:hypothetical protein
MLYRVAETTPTCSSPLLVNGAKVNSEVNDRTDLASFSAVTHLNEDKIS